VRSASCSASTPSWRPSRSPCSRSSRSPEIVATCHELRARLARRWAALYDDTAAIGRLYRRQDEVGTPFCVTVDVKTVGDAEKREAGDGRVTIRDRDSMEQIRVPIADVETGVSRLLDGGATWAEVAAGYPRAEG
jgi:glycyl-tRNA synthetase